jgi:hypothetical protein
LPGHKAHRYADKLMFGKSFPKVHKAIDFPYIIYKRSHRKYFHTYKEALPIGYMITGEAKGALSGAFHVWLDRACSEDKEFKTWLQWATEENTRFRRQMARQKRKMR